MALGIIHALAPTDFLGWPPPLTSPGLALFRVYWGLQNHQYWFAPPRVRSKPSHPSLQVRLLKASRYSLSKLLTTAIARILPDRLPLLHWQHLLAFKALTFTKRGIRSVTSLAVPAFLASASSTHSLLMLDDTFPTDPQYGAMQSRWLKTNSTQLPDSSITYHYLLPTGNQRGRNL